MIVYDFIPANDRTSSVRGDFQEIDFFRGDKVYVMSGYFRENREKLEGYRILLVSLLIKKKYSFKNYGKVTSTEFGPLSISNKRKSGSKTVEEYDSFDYYVSLDDIETEERYRMIQRDTVKIFLGGLNFNFIPRAKN